MRTRQWREDREAVLTLAALRQVPLSSLHGPNGYLVSGLMLWNDTSSTATPPEAVIDLLDGWYGDVHAHNQMRVHDWQVVLYGMVHDFLLPAMGATDYVLEFCPNLGDRSAVRATVPRPHYSDRVLYSTLVRVGWFEVLARTVATINASNQPPHTP